MSQEKLSDSLFSPTSLDEVGKEIAALPPALTEGVAESQTFQEEEVQMAEFNFVVRRGTCDRDVCHSIVMDNEYQWPHPSYYVDNCVLIDIGAYLGIWGIWNIKRLKTCKVLALEPLPENVEMVRRNVWKNGLEGSLEIIQGAVGSGKQVAIKYSSLSTDPGRIHHFIGNAANLSGEKEVTVPIYQLHHLLTEVETRFHTRKVWAVKIDCEGGEEDFFRNAKSEDLRRVFYFIGEHHTGEGRIKNILENAGFVRIPYDKRDNPVPGLFLYRNSRPFHILQ